MFGGEPGPTVPAVDPAPARREFADRVRNGALEVAKPAPEAMREAGLYLFAARATVEVLLPPPGYLLNPKQKPEEAGGGFAALLPDGLTQGPVAFIDENSLIVRGDPEAVDEFREVVALLDKPARPVELSFRLITPAPRMGEGPYAAGVLPGEHAAHKGEARSTASLVVPSNQYAILRTGVAVAFVGVPAEGSPDGYRAGAAVDAREFLVLPRVNADSSVSLAILPTEGGGQVPWAGRPRTAVGVEGPLLLGKDGTAILGGFPRVGELVGKEAGPLRAAEPGASADAQAILLVTARVLPAEKAQAAVPK